MDEFDIIGDILVDANIIKETRNRYLMESYDSYKKANSLLGYFSQLRGYTHEYDSLMGKIMEQRRELLLRYKDILTQDHPDVFKQILIPPIKTEWYHQGMGKYKKVRNYSTYYYRRKLYIILENDAIDLPRLTNIIHTIISLDKYYDIYDEIIAFFMQTSSKFERLMREHFAEHIHF